VTKQSQEEERDCFTEAEQRRRVRNDREKENKIFVLFVYFVVQLFFDYLTNSKNLKHPLTNFKIVLYY